MLDTVLKQVRLVHVTKPWTRDAWERAKPWVLEQRQKLEDGHWTQADSLRTELFALRRPAPSSADTDDGYLYIHMPRKWIDFVRAGKTDADRAAEEQAKGHRHRRVQHRRMLHGHAPSYDLGNPDIYAVRVEQSDEHPSSVLLDVVEPLENCLYLAMCLQPGMVRLHAQRSDVVQPGTRQTDENRDGDAPSVRVRAMVAQSESYQRLLPPSYWMKRNALQLRKILGDVAYDATLAATEDDARATRRTVTDVQEKIWEEALPVQPGKEKKKKHSKKTRQPSVVDDAAGTPPALAAA